MKKIKHTRYSTFYNPSRTAAIVDYYYGSAVYINFKTKQTFTITDRQPGLIFPHWINDTVVTIETSCGSGCTKAVVFVVPDIVFSCAYHNYRIENLNLDEPPDYYHNRPLLIDVKKRIYVCYDRDDNIQVFPFPKYATIQPPKGYFSEKSEIHHNHLWVIYKNRNGKIKQLDYGDLG